MMGIVSFPVLVWLLITMCLIKVSLELDDVNSYSYFVNCGSSENTSVGNRVFLADEFNSSFLSTPQNVFVNTDLKSVSSSYGADLYKTARVFTRVSHYSFTFKKQGRYWIRLHFFPFVDGNYNLENAKFSVSGMSFSLLRDFQPQNLSLVKEYSLNITSDKMILTFTPSSNSFAFVNALEIVFIPEKVIPNVAKTINQQNKYHTLSNQTLETVARVNMGDVEITPENDTLWREWVSDITFLNNINFVNFKSKIGAVNYTNSSASKEIAPSSVYGTATELNSDSDPNTKANITWSYPINPGFEYLFRFHFCDIVSKSPNQLFFNVYINSWLVSQNLDLSQLTSNILGTPYYMDVVTSSIDSDRLSVSIGPSDVGEPYPNGILNGLEIMKLSNSEGSLIDTSSEKKSNKSNWVIIGVAVGVGLLTIFLIMALILFFVCKRNRKESSLGHSIEDPVVNSETATFFSSKIGYRFPFAAIKLATDNFNEINLIGVGGFGKVYKGILIDGTKVAVKRGISENRQGLAEFKTEIEMLSQFKHRHLVSLIGYCHENDEMIIIYEYMENGSLKDHLYGSNHPKMSWRKRLEICIGSARGLHYLHTGSTKPIIHRDVKSANILLDENFLSKVADFGISKSGPEIDESHVSTAVKGSFGYLDPEYLTKQQLTEKSDVYSFGVVMLEILCGRAVIDPSLPREEVNLIEYVKNSENKGELEKLFDSCLKNEIKIDSVRKFLETAIKCLAECGADRPAAGDVLFNLEYALQLQGNDEKIIVESNNNMNNFEISSVSNTQSSTYSFDGVSMSGVFAQMVKGDNNCTDC